MSAWLGDGAITDYRQLKPPKGVKLLERCENVTHEKIHTADPPDAIEICLSCPMGACQEGSAFCPLKGLKRKRGRPKAI